MAITINQTGRRTLRRNDLTVSTASDESGILHFDFELSAETHAELPSDTKIIVEAHVGSSRQRFDFGTAGRMVPPPSTSLTDLPPEKVPQFTVLAVACGDSDGMLLARGRTSPRHEDEVAGSSLLVISTQPGMGETLWSLDLPVGDRPQLNLNNQIPDFAHRLRTDPLVQGLVLPAALRQIIAHYCTSEDDDPESGSIEAQWSALATACAGESWGETQDRETWLDDVVTGFCRRHRFVQKTLATGGDER